MYPSLGTEMNILSRAEPTSQYWKEDEGLRRFPRAFGKNGKKLPASKLRRDNTAKVGLLSTL